MIENLSRGKRLDNDEWVYGNLNQCYGLAYILTEENLAKGLEQLKHGNSEVQFYSIHPNSADRYTGLTDKNGKKIFEGDIVHLYGSLYGENTIYVDYNALIVFKHGGFCAIDGMPYHYSHMRYNLSNCDLHCEVIGNVHDNPELLKEDADET